MQTPQIPPLGDLPTAPDRDTKKGLHDFTGRTAPERVLFFNIGFFKYGTSDKAHGASVALSGALLIMIALVAILGVIVGDVKSEWIKSLLQLLGSAFTFVAGVAIGGGGSTKPEKNEGDE